MKDVNITNFVDTLENTAWDMPHDCCNINAAYDYFINKFNCLYNKSFPIKCKKLNFVLQTNPGSPTESSNQ